MGVAVRVQSVSTDGTCDTEMLPSLTDARGGGGGGGGGGVSFPTTPPICVVINTSGVLVHVRVNTFLPVGTVDSGKTGGGCPEDTVGSTPHAHVVEVKLFCDVAALP